MLTMSYKDKRVLTTDQLATILSTDSYRIRDNHRKNKERFEEGKHYYTLKGEELRAFKTALSNYLTESKVALNRVEKRHSVVELLESPDDATMYVPTPVIGKRANTVTLWTRRGMLRHIKSVNTDAAWDVFERMEDVYFAVLECKQLSEARKESTARIEYKRWRGRAVLTTRDMLKLIPGATKDHIRYVVERDLTSADATVLEGSRLKQFKRENELHRGGKTLRVLYDSGVKKVCAYYNVELPNLEEWSTRDEKPAPETGELTLFETKRQERLNRMIEAATVLLHETGALVNEMQAS